MAVLSGYQPRRWRRVCDVCGTLRIFPDEFVKTDFNVWICVDHAGQKITQELDIINARIVPRAHQPVPNPKPFAPQDTWETQEGQLLTEALTFPLRRFGEYTADNNVRDPFTGEIMRVCWAAFYLLDLVAENKRSTDWIDRATVRLKEIGDYLVTQQVGGPFGFAQTTQPEANDWGAYVRRGANDFYSEDVGAAGLALVRIYRLLKEQRYLDAADAAAWQLRGMQCGDLISLGATSTDSAGLNLVHHGMWTDRFLVPFMNSQYFPGNLIGLEFLEEYRKEVGDILIGSVATSGPFIASRQALISVAIKEARDFWTNGAFDNFLLTNVVGFSAATPREKYNSFPFDKANGTGALGAGTGEWQYAENMNHLGGEFVTAMSWFMGLRSYYRLDGVSVFVLSIWDWLQSFASAPDLEFDHEPRTVGVSGAIDTTDEALRELFLGNAGDYDPALAPSTLLRVRPFGSNDTLLENGTDVYDWASAGLLSGLQAARENFDMQTARIAVSATQPTDKGLRPATYHLLADLGRSGLSFQPVFDSELAGKQDVMRSSMAAGFYRQAPQRFLFKGP